MRIQRRRYDKSTQFARGVRPPCCVPAEMQRSMPDAGIRGHALHGLDHGPADRATALAIGPWCTGVVGLVVLGVSWPRTQLSGRRKRLKPPTLEINTAGSD